MDSYVWHGDTTDKASIINKVARLIRRFVNVVNVHRGSYNDLEISTVVWGDGEVQMFDNLMETIHEEPPGIEFPELLQACLK